MLQDRSINALQEDRNCLYGIAFVKHDYTKGIALIKVLIRDRNRTWTDIIELIYSKMRERSHRGVD